MTISESLFKDLFHPIFKDVFEEFILWQMNNRDIEDSSTGPISYINGAGEIVTIPAEIPIYINGKYGNIGSFHNYLSNPLSPATQTTGILGTGSYTLWNRGGSVAVSAGTATITGAGVATEGNPLHFAVTVAGTVNVTVSGDCTVFQLTDTIFSTEPFLSQDVSTVASRAGTIVVPMEVGDKLYSSLDGFAIPSAFVFVQNSPTTGFTKISDNKYHYIGTGINSELLNNNAISEGEKKQVSFIISNFSDSGNIAVSLGSNATLASYDKNGVYILRANYIDRSYLRFRATFVGSFDIEILHLESIVSKCKLVFKLTPYFNTSDLPVLTTKSILHSGTRSILQFRTDSAGNGYLDFSDGTNTASVALDWENGVQYDIDMLYGNNISESANKMQLVIDSTASALTNFDGSLNPDTEVTIGEACDYPFSISKPTFYDLKQSDWR